MKKNFKKNKIKNNKLIKIECIIKNINIFLIVTIKIVETIFEFFYYIEQNIVIVISDFRNNYNVISIIFVNYCCIFDIQHKINCIFAIKNSTFKFWKKTFILKKLRIFMIKNKKHFNKKVFINTIDEI